MKDFPDCVEWGEVGIGPAESAQWERAAGHHIVQSFPALWEVEYIDWRRLLADRHVAMYDIFNSQVESPIERLLAPWLVWLNGDWQGFPRCGDSPFMELDYRFGKSETFFGVCPQGEVEDFKLDFLIRVHGSNGSKWLGIECDGHEFHEKTKQQVARDKKRDRAILLAGIPVMRFSGSEIWNGIAGCFDHIQEAVQKLVDQAGTP